MLPDKFREVDYLALRGADKPIALDFCQDSWRRLSASSGEDRDTCGSPKSEQSGIHAEYCRPLGLALDLWPEQLAVGRTAELLLPRSSIELQVPATICSRSRFDLINDACSQFGTASCTIRWNIVEECVCLQRGCIESGNRIFEPYGLASPNIKKSFQAPYSRLSQVAYLRQSSMPTSSSALAAMLWNQRSRPDRLESSRPPLSL